MEGDDGWRERETQRQRATWRALMPLVLMLTIIRSSAPRNNSSYRGRTGGLDDSSWGAGGAHYAPNSVTLSKWGTNSSQHAKFAAALQTGRAGGAFDGKASEDHGHERGVGAGRVSPGGAWHREGESSRGEALTFGEEWEDEEREKKRASSSWGKVSTAGGDHDGEGDGGAAREAGEVYDDGSDDEEGRYPARITGLFRGEWEVMDREAMKGAASGFENTRGTVVMQPKTPPSLISGPQIVSHLPGREIREAKTGGSRVMTYGREVGLVQIDLVIRDGEYATARDLHAFMQGLYHRQTGHLNMWSVCYSPGCGALMGGLNFYPPRDESHRNASRLAEALFERENGGKQRTKGRQEAGGFDDEGPHGQRCDLRFRLQVGKAGVAVRTDSSSEAPSEYDVAPHFSEPVLFEPSTISGNGTSTLCGMKMTVNTSLLGMHEYKDKAIRYSIMMTVTSFAQVLLLVRQIEYTTSRNSASHVSIICIGYQAVLDSYLCLFHVTTGILIDSIFSAFVTAAFFKFIIFSVFELRYLLLIFKARNPRAFQEGWDVMRQALSSFYTRFYASLLIGVVLIYNLRSNPAALILLMYSFWVPQILWSAIQGHRSPMLMTYVFGMSATRLVFPLYLLACPSNFFHSQPMPHIAVLAVLWVGAQALVLFCQRLWGPRFFLPKRFLPASYDYYRVMPSQDGADCAICMAAVGPGGQSGDQDSDRVTTPCDHAFHLGCFKQWIHIKLECPVCRRALPEMEGAEEDD